MGSSLVEVVAKSCREEDVDKRRQIVNVQAKYQNSRSLWDFLANYETRALRD